MPTFTVKEKVAKKVEVESQTIEDADAILLQAVLKYKELQAKVNFVLNEMKASRSIIESAAMAAKGGVIVTEQFKVSLVDVERENFDKKAAIEALGRKKLAPFLSTTTFKQLRVS